MITFLEFINTPAFNISRLNMPQINDQEKFKSFLDENNIGYILKDGVDEYTLLPTQQEYDKDKVQKIIDSGELITSKNKRIVISNDNYVVDGHHRMLAHQKAANRTFTYALEICLPINKSLKIAQEFCENYKNDTTT